MKQGILLWLMLLTSVQVALAQQPAGVASIADRFDFISDEDQFSYDVSVHLPDRYEERKDTMDFDCLYLFIGGEDLYHSASGMARLLSRHGDIPQMIIVGVTNIRWWPDLTPEKIEWKEESGNAKAFLTFISDQLIPWVDDSYATTDQRIYMGHSLSGMFGIYSLVEDKDLFDDYILISPSIQNRANSLFDKLETLVTSKTLDNDVYFTVGTEGRRMSEGSYKLATIFSHDQGEKLRWKLEHMPDKDHFTIIFPSITNGLKYVCEDNKAKN